MGAYERLIIRRAAQLLRENGWHRHGEPVTPEAPFDLLDAMIASIMEDGVPSEETAMFAPSMAPVREAIRQRQLGKPEAILVWERNFAISLEDVLDLLTEAEALC